MVELPKLLVLHIAIPVMMQSLIALYFSRTVFVYLARRFNSGNYDIRFNVLSLLWWTYNVGMFMLALNATVRSIASV